MSTSIISGNPVWNLLSNYQPTLATRPNEQITSINTTPDQNGLMLNLIIALLQQLLTKMEQNLAGAPTQQNTSTATQPTVQQNTSTSTQPTVQQNTSTSTSTQPSVQQNTNTSTQPAPIAQVQPVNNNPQTPHQKVIDVYLLGGQSNAVGLGAPRLEKALENTLGADTAQHETNVFSYAVSGSNLFSQWKADGTADKTKDGGLYQSFQTQLDAHIKALQKKNPDAQINIAGMFWHQGESDAIGGKSKEYTDNLSRFIQDVRATTANPTLPFMIGRLTNTTATAQYKLGDVQRAQDEVANKTPNTVSVKMEEAEPSNIHFTAKGYDTMAKLFANAYAENFVKKT